MFAQTRFIKPNIPFDPADTRTCYAPMFRKKFTLPTFQTAVLRFCALGFGHVSLNGRRIDSEVFGTDESVYHKTLWYREEDVSVFLHPGENVIHVLCGNGFFNEIFPSSWNFNEARWRDLPKVIAELEVDGQVLLRTNGSWKCSVDGPIVYNQIRGGERYDARREAPFAAIDYDDSGWQPAAEDQTPPTGVFRLRCMPPVIEAETLTAQQIIDCGDGRYIYDFGVNMSGYARLSLQQKAGDELEIFYGEDREGCRIWATDRGPHYPVSDYQTDHVICGHGPLHWSPSFSYHGFRYIQVTGLTHADEKTVKAVFIHQNTPQVGSFHCSDERLNRLFAAGIQATLSNFVLKPTDCPTREKLGWANDLQMSCEQMLLHFDAAAFFRGYLQSARDTIRDSGALPGIIPTDVWGYDWGNGPVSEGVLFEMPWQIYRYTGDASELIRCLPYILRNLAFYKTHENSDGFCDYGLDDWAPPQYFVGSPVPRPMVVGSLVIHLMEIACLAAELAGEQETLAQLRSEHAEYRRRYMQAFLDGSGRCVMDHLTPVAMIIAFGLYEDLAPLAQQLKELVEQADFHHDCGMVGLRRLYDALSICGLQEYAYRIITSEGFPSYYTWLDQGATTLWEMWDCTHSHNHHMYSDFMSWLTRNIAGIQVAEPGMKRVTLQPTFVEQLQHCEGGCRGWHLRWQRNDGGIDVTFTVPEGCTGSYAGTDYPAGTYTVRS